MTVDGGLDGDPVPPRWWAHRECDQWPEHACEACTLHAAGDWRGAFEVAVEADEA